MDAPSDPDARQMRSRLQRSAVAHAASALAQLTRDDDDLRVRGAIDAGVAVEHMAKAYLATLHPVLLVERNLDFDSLLHLSGNGVHAKNGKHEIRTVSAHEACQRVARVLPTFKYVDRVDSSLFVTRNGGAHLALVTEDSARGAARIMVRLLEPLIGALGLERERFWGQMLVAADGLLDESVNEINAILEVKYSAARSRLAARLDGLNTEQQAIVLAAISGHLRWSSDHDEPWKCPVCEQVGSVICGVEDGDVETEYERVGEDEYEAGASLVNRTAYAFMFECSACGLELKDRELDAAGIPSEFELEPRDYEPFDFDGVN